MGYLMEYRGGGYLGPYTGYGMGHYLGSGPGRGFIGQDDGEPADAGTMEVDVTAPPLDVELPLQPVDQGSGIDVGSNNEFVDTSSSDGSGAPSQSWWDKIMSGISTVTTDVSKFTTSVTGGPRPGDPGFVGPVEPGIFGSGSSSVLLLGLGVLAVVMLSSGSTGRRRR
jgi:hypothetical protein